jgi:hypothetical protein
MGSRAAVMPGATPPNPLMAAFTAGVVFALFQGGFYKVSLPGLLCGIATRLLCWNRKAAAAAFAAAACL